MIVEDLQPSRMPAKNPLLRVMFVLMSGEEKTWRTPDGTMEPLIIEESKAKFDLMLHLRDTARGIQGALVYDKALFDSTMASRIASHYETLLSGMVADPAAHIHSLPLVGGEERERILKAWNDTATPYPASRTVHALFREQAQLNPGAVAVVPHPTARMHITTKPRPIKGVRMAIRRPERAEVPSKVIR